jgi:hypothetical protein
MHKRDDATQVAVQQGGTPGLMTMVNAMLVGVPAAYTATHSVVIAVITAAVTFGVILAWRWIR